MKQGTLVSIVALVAACRSTATPEANTGVVPAGVPSTIAPAAVSAHVEAPPASTTPPAPALPTMASLSASVAADVRWILAVKRERRFQRAALDGVGTLHVVWTRDVPHPDPRSGMPVARVGLELTRDHRTTRVEAGEVAGEIQPEGATLCGRLGYRMSNGALLTPPAVDGLVSSLSVGDMSGSDELMVVLGPTALYVLRGQTTDGMCESMTTQGPLTVCKGQEYARVAEIALAPATDIDETIRTTTEDDAGVTVAPLDCAVPTMMGTLSPPPRP
jgi:hypothetical protein